MGEGFNFPSLTASSTLFRNADSERIRKLNIHAFPVLFVPGDLVLLPAIQRGTSVVFWLLYIWGARSEEQLEAPEVGSFNACAADVEGEGDWDPSDLTCSPDVGHQCLYSCWLWPASKDVFDCYPFSSFVCCWYFYLAVWDFSTLSGRLVLDTPVGAHEATLETTKERLSTR